ncbi:hypothetical protein WH47_03917 [Habropoda laboriosa]|uniref:Uncharacterized protein n=1 Tax=Habropoda laboriosa TaxID=597456 RepID=A0A0L7QUC1_9HYME|nr:hypothetical protein WH47_03917 [Habropoda laboriosa]
MNNSGAIVEDEEWKKKKKKKKKRGSGGASCNFKEPEEKRNETENEKKKTKGRGRREGEKGREDDKEEEEEEEREKRVERLAEKQRDTTLLVLWFKENGSTCRACTTTEMTHRIMDIEIIYDGTEIKKKITQNSLHTGCPTQLGQAAPLKCSEMEKNAAGKN